MPGTPAAAPTRRRRTAAGRSALLLVALLLVFGQARRTPAADVQLDSKEQQEGPTAFAAEEPKPVLRWGVGDGKSYFVPAYEIVGFELLLNRFNRYAFDDPVYGSPIANLRGNWGTNWVVDSDRFSTNQFLHPYQGAIYQGFARSAGLGFWESFGYTLAGSLLWEEAGENSTPSINDQVASGVAGNFLGEPLFRIASLLLESSASGRPGFWRELGAAVISPPTGLNRVAYGDRFGGVFRSNAPAVFTRVDLGASVNTRFKSNASEGPGKEGTSQSIERRLATANFTMAYGLPGKPGYTYTRPFDYFHFEFTAATRDAFENVFSRGLLYGTKYQAGDDYRGVWGLYGTYSYVAPQVFRVSTTAVALGTTAQGWLSRRVALQGTALAGVGYGGGGVIHGAGITAPDATGEGRRDFHYGVVPQGQLSLRLILGDRLSADTTAREYYISDLGATESSGSENILRADASLTLRVYNLHGLTLRYAVSSRDGRYEDRRASQQTVETVSVAYTLLGQTRFGAVDWRPPADGGP